MVLTRDERVVVLSALIDRLDLAGTLGVQFGGDRKMYEILGYPTTIAPAQYLAKYKRQDIAGRVVDLPAIDTWRNAPNIHDGKSSTAEENPTSQFILGVKRLVEKRRLWHYLQRVDRLSGIGRFGVLLIGVTGKKNLSQPLATGELKSVDDVIYLSTFAEASAPIAQSETDTAKARFGLPVSYNIQLISGAGAENVHWSRVIHVAEDLLEDEVYGRPRLERVYDRLDDLMKIVGGGAEATWKVMDRGLQADIRDGFTGDGQTLTDLETEIDEYVHGLRRVIRTKGVDVNDLGSTEVDPTGLFNILVSLIAAASDIPQRILLGSERGELASSQDQAGWAGRIRARQTQFAEPMMLRPLIDRLVDAGALPKPTTGSYSIEWPSLFEMSDAERADIALKTSQAVATVAPAGAPDIIISPDEFREKYLGLPPRSSNSEEAILDGEDQQSELDNQDGTV